MSEGLAYTWLVRLLQKLFAGTVRKRSNVYTAALRTLAVQASLLNTNCLLKGLFIQEAQTPLHKLVSNQ